jgi:hypothetical protein
MVRFSFLAFVGLVAVIIRSLVPSGVRRTSQWSALNACIQRHDIFVTPCRPTNGSVDSDDGFTSPHRGPMGAEAEGS